MPQFESNGVDDLIKKLDRMGRLGEIAPKMLEESVDILKEEVVAEAGQHMDTGAMVESIQKTGTIALPSGGYYICVRPTGIDKKGVRNMAKMVYLEYGVKGRAATPILTKATMQAAPKVEQKMREVFEREVSG